MAIKTVLVPIVLSAGGRNAVATAFLVARASNAHVVGLYAPPARRDLTAEAMMLSRATLGASNADLLAILSRAEQQEPADIAAARRMFEEAAEAAGAALIAAPPSDGPSASFRVLPGGVEAVAVCSRVFDLVVVSQPRTDPGHMLREALRAVLFDSGRPILVAPEAAPSSVGERLLIAWNGSSLSARAAAIVRQHFLPARKVGILSVSTPTERDVSGRELAAHLAWYGIEAQAIEVERGARHLGDVFLQEAAAFGADLLVMGAYSKSPFRESLTRGVTNHVLTHARLPVLMTH